MIESYIKLLEDFNKIPKHKREKTFMEISGYPHYENVCSNILAFYLNPFEEHGLKDLVLISLLKSVDEDFFFSNNDENIEIYREQSTDGNNRLDLLVLTDRYSIGIENKIFHYLHNDLNDYEVLIKKNCDELRQPINIVLSPKILTSKDDIDKMYIAHFKNITYGKIYDKIKVEIGNYLNKSNLSYINHLNDFFKTIENLISKPMENKKLNTFFKENYGAIEAFTHSFNQYKNEFYNKVNQLKEELSIQDTNNLYDKIWVYQKDCLVFDYTIKNEHKIAIDTQLSNNGWEITLFGRGISSDFFIKEMLPVLKQSNEKLFNGEINSSNRLVYTKIDAETDLTAIAEILMELLKIVDEYKRKLEI